MHEVVSGCAPLDRRTALVSLLQRTQRGPNKTKKETAKKPTKNAPVQRIYCESSRDVARDMLIGEALYNMSVAMGVEIVPADSPDLFKHNPSPTEKWSRRVQLCNQELEKDKIRERLQDGIRRAYSHTSKVTQHGKAKVNGRNSVLDAVCTNGVMKKTVQKQLAKLFQARDRGEFGWRPLATKVCAVLKLESLSHEAVRRMKSEFESKWG